MNVKAQQLSYLPTLFMLFAMGFFCPFNLVGQQQQQFPNIYETYAVHRVPVHVMVLNIYQTNVRTETLNQWNESLYFSRCVKPYSVDLFNRSVRLNQSIKWRNQQTQ